MIELVELYIRGDQLSGGKYCFGFDRVEILLDCVIIYAHIIDFVCLRKLLVILENFWAADVNGYNLLPLLTVDQVGLGRIITCYNVAYNGVHHVSCSLPLI